MPAQPGESLEASPVDDKLAGWSMGILITMPGLGLFLVSTERACGRGTSLRQPIK